MEEILASIRRIISDDDAASTAPASPPKAAAPAASPPRTEAPRPAPAPAKPAAPLPRDDAAIQNEIRAVLSEPAMAADDGSTAQAGDALVTADTDILELTEEMTAEPAAPAPAAAAFRTIDGQPDVFFAEKTPEADLEPEPESEPELEPVHRLEAAPAHALSQADAPTYGFDHSSDRGIMSEATSAAVDSAFNHLAQFVFTQNGRTIEDLVRDMLRPMLKTWLDDNLPGLVERLVRAEIERVSRGR
jgi:uncharacterized protein